MEHDERHGTTDINMLKILAWGTYDLTKPRVRILLQALRESGADLEECHVDVWRGTIDKSQIKGIGAKLRFTRAWLLAYPRLIRCLFHQPKPDVIFVGYLGLLDVLVLWPFAKFLRTPVAWDTFISLYNTVVEDRRMMGPRHPLALLLYSIEWLATRAVNQIIVDTKAHAHYFVERFNVHPEKIGAIFVGAETEIFKVKASKRDPNKPFTVLFFGQFIPLHGIDTIIEAARLLAGEDIHWILIGKGQEAERIQAMLDEHPLKKVEWLTWVAYEELAEWIGRADLCLGIFGDGEKASRVIPNKVYQILSAGKPLVTRDSQGIRELVSPDDRGVTLVPAKDAKTLADTIKEQRSMPPVERSLHDHLKAKFSLNAIGNQLVALLRCHLRDA